MNKIERAISDIKSHIKSLDRDILVLETERKAFKKQLDALEKIQDDISIPHDENIPTWDKSHSGGFSIGSISSEPDEVSYASICSCNPKNGGSGLCGCIMGNEMIPNPKKYLTGVIGTTTTNTTVDMTNGDIIFAKGDISFTNK
jgi:hypothetical protein